MGKCVKSANLWGSGGGGATSKSIAHRNKYRPNGRVNSSGKPLVIYPTTIVSKMKYTVEVVGVFEKQEVE